MVWTNRVVHEQVLTQSVAARGGMSVGTHSACVGVFKAVLALL